MSMRGWDCLVGAVGVPDQNREAFLVMVSIRRFTSALSRDRRREPAMKTLVM
jgi:hypothetical protein